MADPSAATTDDDARITPVADATADLVQDEVLVEEISIDGMCGVY